MKKNTEGILTEVAALAFNAMVVLGALLALAFAG